MMQIARLSSKCVGRVARKPVIQSFKKNFSTLDPKLLAFVVPDVNFEQLISSAQTGDRNAQVAAGLLFGETMNSTKITKDESLRYFKMAADKGHVRAQYLVADACYDNKDYTESFKYYTMAAHQGSEMGINGVGLHYFYGYCVDKDIDYAFKCFKLAADLGYPAAQRNVGICFAEGEGIAADPVMAFKYFKLAADKGNPSACFNLGNNYLNGAGVPENHPEAFRYYRMSSDLGSALGANSTGYCYEMGFGTPSNSKEAFNYLQLKEDQTLDNSTLVYVILMAKVSTLIKSKLRSFSLYLQIKKMKKQRKF